ncbi:related to carbonic anhydrase [Cephalotrichum gorgonifer]|uniref:Carbonic anhydrase n=1 Tax=Cephalotrichum gorgonifer TaxID=2041049 RepID=A0AAE8MSD8_9PEZI|nr:related to carbonic anhydrase [Cephalotrichum gorgonifer]
MPALREHIMEASKRYSNGFKHKGLASPPSNHFIFVTCMDARIDTAQAFGIAVGEAHVIRNAGGSAADALRSIVISQQLLGTKEIAIIKHTKCGMDGLKNEVVHATILRNLGIEAIAEVKSRNMIDFVPISGVAQGVIDDVEFLKASPLIHKDIEVTGWVYDVETGSTKRII